MHRLATLAVAFLAAGLSAQNLVATVDDPMSHGVLGDARLSLSEAILVLNGTVSLGSLSPSERARIVGIGTTLDTIRIDAAQTPTITYERDLPPIAGQNNSGVTVRLLGLRANGVAPTLLAGAVLTALEVRTNRIVVQGLQIFGAAVGIDIETSTNFVVGQRGSLTDLALAGQTQSGMRLRTHPLHPGSKVPFTIERTQLFGQPTGFEVLMEAPAGALEVVAELVTLTGCTVGAHLQSDGSGGRHSFELFRCAMTGGDHCIRLRRAIGNDTEWLVRTVYGPFMARHNVFDVEGSTAGADTIFHHHQLDIRAGAAPTDYALLAGPSGARFDLHTSENRYDGNISIMSGRLSRRLWMHVNHFTNGTFDLENEGVRPDLQWNVFESCPIRVAATNRVTFPLLDCELIRSPVTDLTAFGTTSLTNCFRASSSVTANVVVQNPAPARWLGQATVTPGDPPRGGFVDFGVDLQPGTAGVWYLGASEARPVTSNYPFRFYLQLGGAVLIPGVFTDQGRFRLGIPNLPIMAGAEFFAQPLVVPIAGQTYVPPLSMPRGGRFKIV